MTTSKLRSQNLKLYNLYPGMLSYEIEEQPHCSTFLSFARKDLENSRDMRAIVNAVSNSKKALHRRVERLCEVLGYELNKNKRNNFPSKLEYLNKCGLITPRILYRLNTVRNKIEHDYEAISYEEAEDFVDIIELFLMATGLFLKSFPKIIEGDLKDDKDTTKQENYRNLPQSIEFELKLNTGNLGLRICEENGERITIDISEQDYFEWLSILISSYFDNY